MPGRSWHYEGYVRQHHASYREAMPEETLETFGTRLRELRGRTKPEELGFRGGGRRRVSGLRREELAALADMSVDYLTRLEQGSAQHPSPEVVSALGRALRLSRLEIGFLHQLAGHAAPTDLEIPRHLSPGVQRLINRLDEVPLAVYDATWTLIAANRPWRRLRGPIEAQPGYNLIRATFTDAVAGESAEMQYRERLQRSLVGDLRLSAARYPADSSMRSLLQEMIFANAAFAAIWAEGQARPFNAEPKRLSHPVFGEFWLDCDVLSAAEGDTRIVMYTAAQGSRGELVLRSLAGLTQDR